MNKHILAVFVPSVFHSSRSYKLGVVLTGYRISWAQGGSGQNLSSSLSICPYISVYKSKLDHNILLCSYMDSYESGYTYYITKSESKPGREEALGSSALTGENVVGRAEGSKGLVSTGLSPLQHDKTEFPCALSLSDKKDSNTETCSTHDQVPPLPVVTQRLTSVSHGPVGSSNLKLF